MLDEGGKLIERDTHPDTDRQTDKTEIKALEILKMTMLISSEHFEVTMW